MERSMYIELRSKLVANWVKVLLRRTMFLQLTGHQSLVDLLQLDPSPEQQIFRELKVLILSKVGPRSLSIPSPAERVSGTLKKVPSDSVRFTSFIPSGLLVNLQNLQKLVIMNCEYLEKLIQFEDEDQAASVDASLLSRINVVKFSNLPASSVFPNLTYIRVCACAGLRYLFPMRLIRHLSQLEMLHISNCQRMKMVTVHENAEDVCKAGDEKAIFPKLKVLSLEGLKSLSLIAPQEVHLALPALEELKVDDCGGLKKLPFGPGSVPQLTKLVVDDDDWFDDLIWDDQKVKQRLLRLLNSLQLKGYGSLKDVELHDQWHPTSKSVRVTDYKGTTLIPCNFLKKMLHLKNLVIKNSRELQVIDFGEEDDTIEEEMHSAGSSSLSANKCEFSKSTQYPAFGNLSCLRVSGCSGLKYLCPVRVIRALLQLEKLYIHDCSGMEMMIENEIENEIEMMILPKLRILSLHSLGKLWCTGLESGHLELPGLEELMVKGCENLSFNGSYAPVLQWDNGKVNNELANRLYLKRCTSLKVIELDGSWHPSLVRFLIVDGYEGATIVHCGLLRRPWNLDKLVVRYCPNLEALVEFGGENKAVETCMFASSSSAENDNDLSKLSSSLVFSNLTFLDVSGCHKLRYLLPVTVVRNMAQLKELRVGYCNSIETIIEYEAVVDEGDAEKDKVLLRKLKKLTLRELPQLSSFVGGDILFDWPSLTRIWVDNCLGLKKLPLGPDSALKLKTCDLYPKEWLDALEWEDEEIKSRVLRVLVEEA